MKNKKIKIIFTIILMLIIALATSNIYAAFTYNGTTHYTKNDISWNGSQINFNGKYYWCINHKWTLTKGMGRNEDFTIKKTSESSVQYGSETLDTNSKIRMYQSKQIEKLKNQIMDEISIDGRNHTASIKNPNGTIANARNAKEAAIYAFAKEFNCSNSSIRDSIWNYENELNPANCGAGKDNYLWRAVNGYIDWGKPISLGSGKYKTNIDANNLLEVEDASSKVNLDTKRGVYSVGPLKVSYDAGLTYTNGSNTPIKFVKDVEILIKDQNGNSINSLKIVDVSGKEYATIPNGTEFFLEFPYVTDVSEIKISAKLKYISQIWGQSKTFDTQVHVWYYEAGDDVQVTHSTVYQHSGNCGAHPGVQTFYTDWISPRNLFCDGLSDTCIIGGTGGNAANYCYTTKVGVTANLKKSDKVYEDAMQNMRTFDGSVTWSPLEKEITVKIPDDNKRMIIEGNVWEDTNTGKDSKFNGSLDSSDIMLEGIEVRLYEANGTLAEVGNTNPTLTDKNGHYKFTEVDPTKKYFVQFTYDGMIYTNTYRTETNELTYNTEEWNAVSKGSEIVSDRARFNSQFVTIGSYPMGYKPSKAIFTDMAYLVDGYNEVYSITHADVLAYKAKITEQLKNYLQRNKTLLDENYIKEIYQPILGRITDNTEAVKARKILQYIWDCRIQSYAGYESVRDGKTVKNDEMYPYYDKIILEDGNGDRVTANEEKNINGYWVIYNGQLNVNQGIIRREQTDLSILEDLYKNVVSINGKDVEYPYGSMSSKSLEVTSADIQTYTQNIAKSDYNYKIASSTLSSDLTQTSEYPEGYAPIQIYITYSINVKNNKSTPTSVNEIVTYINTKYYSYSDEYTTTQGKTLYGVEGSFIRNNEEKSLADYGVEIKANASSISGERSQTGTDIGTDLYISFNNNVVLNNNDALRLYVTYRLGEDSTKDAKYSCTYNDSNRGNSAQVILQDALAEENSELRLGTQTEINSFSTYYAQGSDVASTQAKYANYYTYTSVIDPYTKYRAAGVLDGNSIPGNLTIEEMQNKTEDDWDNAAVLVIKKPGDGNDTRKLIGNVWEVTRQVDGVEQYTESYWANTEDYPIYDSTHAVKENDVTVELIELKNGIEYVRARTTTDDAGNYVLDGFIPGDYTVRFIYGDRAQYDTEQFSEYSKFIINQQELKRPYNGMFYQSTKANPNTNENKYWYAGEEADNTRYSDAYDETEIRLRLAASQQEYTYGDVVDVLRQPSKYMGYAYTSMLDISIEKALTVTRIQNPAYEISNIDFGLTPRSLSNLDVKKEVTHLKLVLANGVVHFDADTSTIREQGVPGVVQAAQGYDINVSMSSELVNGATLEITYAITVTNNTPVDKIIHYKDASNNVIAIGLYNEDAEKLVAFEDAIRVYKNNLSNFERLSDGDNSTFDPLVSKVEAGTTELVQLDKSKKEIIQSETRALAVADFIPNNLNFIKTNYSGQVINDGWDLYTGRKDELKELYYTERISPNPPTLGEPIDDEGNRRANEVDDSNVIVLANENNPLITTNLKPGESVSSQMVLSKVISVNSDSTDTKSYQNNVRVLKIYSSDSRLQDMPGTESEKVIISDPTGIGNIYIVIALALVVFAIIGLGVVLIKKFVMTRK